MKKVIVVLGAAALPIIASAQGTAPQPTLSSFSTLLTNIGHLVNIALPIVVGIALLGFFWGLAQFVFAAGDEEKRGKAKQHMIWGVIALFVMVAVWGLVNFLASNLGISTGNQNQPNVPTVPNVQ